MSSTNEERREAAKRKLAERLERENRQARRRKIVIASVSAAVAVAVVATATYFVVDKIRTDRYNAAHNECTYTPTPSQLDKVQTTIPEELKEPDQRALYQRKIDSLVAGKPKQRTSPKPALSQPNSGTESLTLDTNQGTIPITVERKSAPCNSAAILSLAKNGYYDNTPCHRMTNTEIKVIQCGDPTATGGGTPGWTSPDEPPTDLKPAGEANQMTGQQPVTYPRGTVAIANSGQAQQGQANAGGAAQFFILVQDGVLPASYAVVGKVDEPGLAVVDKVFQGGIEPSVNQNPMTRKFEMSPTDGPPKLGLTIEKATVGG